MSIQFSESTFRALERLRTEPPSSEQYRGNPGIPPAARCHTGEAHTGNLGEPHGTVGMTGKILKNARDSV
jgi:hypothetical protein